jgi:hypothetical protein
LRVFPIRIKAGALGEGAPSGDLRLPIAVDPNIAAA